MRKTFKREAGVASIAALTGIAIYAVTSETPALIDARGAIVAALAFPTFSFAAFAFGADWVAKQTDWGGPSSGVAADGWPNDIIRSQEPQGPAE